MISILMPIYNTKKELLDRAIHSCLWQTFTNFEIVIVNNGSDLDETNNALDLHGKLPIVRVLNCPRSHDKRNLSRALNHGIANIDNSFIARMDGDDVMSPYRLEKQIKYMQKNPDLYVLGTQIKFRFGGGISTLPKIITPKIAIEAKWNWFLAHPTVMMRKELFTTVGNYAEEIVTQPEDLELWFRVLQHNLRMENLDENLLLYNDDGNGEATREAKNSEWQKNIDMMKEKFKISMGL